MKSPIEPPMVAALALLFASATTAVAAVCTVPSGSHPTIQAAVDDPTCTEVAIAAGTYAESVEVDRTLEISGASSTTTIVEGRIALTGTGVELTLDSLKVDASAPSVAGCYPFAVDISGGSSMSGNDLVVVNGGGDACLLFRDGFESGNTGAWSNTNP